MQTRPRGEQRNDHGRGWAGHGHVNLFLYPGPQGARPSELAEARKLVREVNSKYGPTPLASGPRDDDGALTAQPFEGDFLRENEWGRSYGFLSELVHARHPYARLRELASIVKELRSLSYRVAILLRQHAIVLAGNQDAYLGQLDVDGGEVLVAVLRRPENS